MADCFPPADLAMMIIRFYTFVLFIGLRLCLFAQTQTQLYTEVLTTPYTADLRLKLKRFEDQTGIDLSFRVKESDLESLSGLSGHLLKLFQQILPESPHVLAIQGQFGTDKSYTAPILRYHTEVSADLASCAFSNTFCTQLDSFYNQGLIQTAAGIAQNAEDVPTLLDEFYPQVIYDYSQQFIQSASCNNPFDEDAYAIHVRNTRNARSINWQSDIESISLALTTDMGLLNLNGYASPSNTLATVNLSVNPNTFNGHFIIDLNNCFNECTRKDLEVRSRMLFKKTAISYLFLTKSLAYYIPIDSLARFADSVVHQLLKPPHNNQVIVALWLQMHDASANAQVLLVRQSGQWLSVADINQAALGSTGRYKQTAFYKYASIYTQIPKPLIICFQTAKINGLLTTTYLNVAQHVKGKSQLYCHVFKIDQAFNELNQLQEQLKTIENSNNELGLHSFILNNETDKLKQEIKRKYAQALLSPQFVEADIHFKENYLQDKDIAHAAALRFLKHKYPTLFKNNQIDQLIDLAGLPEFIHEGSCNQAPQGSDVIGNFLGISSLILAPTGLDFIPDACSVVYFAANDQTIDCVLAGASLLVPGNLNTIKRTVTSTAKALEEVKHGNYLITQGTQLLSSPTQAHLVAGTFGIPIQQADADFVQLVDKYPHAVQQLLAIETQKAQLFTHIADKIPPEQRLPCIQKALTDEAFRKKILNDPDEVLRWAKVVEKIRGVTKTEFIASVAEFSAHPALAEIAWQHFCKQEWAQLEMLFVKNGWNNGWPPNKGFIDYYFTTLEVGTVFDRYGGRYENGVFTDNGFFAADPKTTFEQRALPVKYEKLPRKKYRVLKPIPNVKKGKSIPWFNQTGNGEQYLLSEDIDTLIKNKFIEEILS